VHQTLKFSFSYLTYRWLCPQGVPMLRLENDEEKEFGVFTKGFPVVGLRVRIFWTSWGESYYATVKRWSSTNNAWVLKYDLWKDSVVEDVPVTDWEFVE
jgi:hypothetical protein